jgi:hypothetical protein
MWQSKDSGEGKWKHVPCYKVSAIQDFVVQSTDVLYAIDTAGCSTSTNAGASWSTKKALDGQEGYMITLAPNNDILVGCKNYVVFSKDGGETFKSTKSPGSGYVSVVADKDYATNNTIYFGVGSAVKRGKADDSSTPSTRGIERPDGTGVGDGQTVKGMAQFESVIYVLTSNSTDSELWRALDLLNAATTDLALWSFRDSTAELGQTLNGPQPLKISPTYKSNEPKLWAIDADNSLYSLNDPIVLTGPTLGAPADLEVIPVNPITGRAYNITFTWTRYHSTRITKMDIQIATDAAFNAVVFSGTATGIDNDDVARVIGPTTSPLSTDFMPNRTYYWRIRVAQDSPMLSPWSDARSFTVESELPFTITGPEAGAVGVPITPTMTWSEHPGALGYEVAIAEDETFSVLDISHSATHTFYQVEEELKYSTTYYWRVRAITKEAYTVGKTVYPAEGSDWVNGVFTTMAEPVEPPPPGDIIVEPPEVVVPPPEVIVQPAQIPDYLLWTIIGIGVVLVIALIVLIVRTRRVV